MTRRPYPRPLAFIAALATFLIAYLAHASMIRSYGVEVPFWDQWAAEGAQILKPWAEGNLSWAAMVAPWNEHRIFFTRLLTIAMYESNGGHWNILATEYVNAAIYALTPALLTLLLASSSASRQSKAGMALAIVIFFVLPHGWENTIAAFQSQFYFLLLFTVVGLSTAALLEHGWRHSLLLAVIAIAANFTMAPGVLVGPAICVILLARARTYSYPWRAALASITILAIVFVASYLTTPKLAQHMALHAQDVKELARSTVLVASWPTASPGKVVGTAILWIPSVAATWFVLRRSWNDRFDILMLGMAAWAAAQVLGIAYSRGHDMLSVTPRYTDVLVLGVLANAWFAIRLSKAKRPAHGSTARQIASKVPMVLMALVISRGYIASWDVTEAQIEARRDSGLMHQAHIQAYLDNGRPEELNQPMAALPFPDPAGLKSLLDDPTIRSMLIRTAPDNPQGRSNP